MALVNYTHPSSGTFKSLPAVCQAPTSREVTAMGRGCIPRRLHGYLVDKKVETVESYKINTTKIDIAKITLQRLL